MLSFGNPQDGLQELTSDISRLVNLKELTLECNGALSYIPQALSCLQKLETTCVGEISVNGMSFSLPGVANLTGLCIWHCEDIRFPPSLQVADSFSPLTCITIDSTVSHIPT